MPIWKFFAIYGIFLSWLTNRCFATARSELDLLLGIFILEGSLTTLIATIFSYQRTYSLILGKNEDGTFPYWSYALFWPIHFFVWIVSNYLDIYFFRKKEETHYTEVHPKCFIGGIHSHTYNELNRPTTVIVDMTCEFSRKIRSEYYLVLPTWDGTPPTVQQVNEGVRFLMTHREKGSVLIHCGYGRGRSAVMMVCYLVAAGYHGTWEEAFAHMKKMRPRVHLNKEMSQVVIAWQKQRS